jgi:hypothetical protein
MRISSITSRNQKVCVIRRGGQKPKCTFQSTFFTTFDILHMNEPAPAQRAPDPSGIVVDPDQAESAPTPEAEKPASKTTRLKKCLLIVAAPAGPFTDSQVRDRVLLFVRVPHLEPDSLMHGSRPCE